MVMTEKEKTILTAGLIFAGMLLIIFIYLHFVYFAPGVEARKKQVDALVAEKKKLTADLASMQAFVKNQAEVEQMKQQITRAMAKLPSQPNAVEFLDELRTTLERTGVKQSRVEPLKPTMRNLYTELPYIVQGSARYHEFGQFLNLIECNPRRFMRVSSFDVRNNNNRPMIHPISVGMSTFMFNRGG